MTAAETLLRIATIAAQTTIRPGRRLDAIVKVLAQHGIVVRA